MNNTKFNYTEFLDQALINSLNNVDPKQAPLYTNPLLRSSVNGVVSHRIKNLLGNSNNYSGAMVFNNYSQKVDTAREYDEQQKMIVTAHKLGGTARKKHSVMHLRAESLDNPSGSIQSSVARLAKNELNFDSVKNI